MGTLPNVGNIGTYKDSDHMIVPIAHIFHLHVVPLPLVPVLHLVLSRGTPIVRSISPPLCCGHALSIVPPPRCCSDRSLVPHHLPHWVSAQMHAIPSM